MTTEAELMARASRYALGLMGDAERERAEHDLEVDATFRDAVVQVAQRMHLINMPQDTASEHGWKTIASRIADFPQMRGADRVAAPERSEASDRSGAFGKGGAIYRGPQSAQGSRALAIAMAMIAACAIGYAAGVMTGGLW